jgi:nitroreductase
MGTIPGETLLSQLNWRYATSKFDTTRKIPAEQWSVLERAMALAPSSNGLQPWVFVVVTDPATRVKLRAAGYDQAKITEASHLVVFCRQRTLTPEYVERYLARMASVRNQTMESLAGLRASLMRTIGSPEKLPGGGFDAWNAREVYIALGFFVYTAAMMGIDAGPMEGFEPSKFDEILGLEKRGLASTVICAAGYRAADDPRAGQAKVRWDMQDVVIRV